MVASMSWVGWLIGIAAGLWLLVYFSTRLAVLLRYPRDRGGDPKEGLVVFAESIRWMGVRWGLNSLSAGLRRAGFAGQVRYWRWHEWWRGWLVVPAIADRPMLEHRAQELAEYLTAERRAHPDRPLHLVGYSCGGFVATRALELLPEEIAVDSAVLLAAAVDPKRDLNLAAGHVRGLLVVASSVLDFVIIGLGTVLVGTGDRKHRMSLGVVGYRGPACRKVVEFRWRPGYLKLGHFGGHFAAPAAGFIAAHVAPKMGISSMRGDRT